MFCVTLAEKSLSDIKTKIKNLIDITKLFEIRLDALSLEWVDEEFFQELQKIKDKYPELKLIYTFRSPREGGLKKVEFAKRKEILMKALYHSSAFLVDFEWNEFKEDEDLINQNEKYLEKMLFSYHLFDKGLELEEGKKLLEEMKEKKVKWAKIVSTPKELISALHHLELLDYAKKLGIKLISFGMGEKAKFTRILCLFFSSPFTYVASSKESAVAPGQIDIFTAKQLYNALKALF